MTENELQIRPMQPEELNLMLDWAADEGWNPGLNDARCYYQADPKGFLLGLVGGEPVATISVVRYSDSLGFLGFYIVRPEYRGRGYGMQVWNAGMAYLAGCNVALDGVVAQQDNYARSGFRLAWNNVRYAGNARHSEELTPSSVTKLGPADLPELFEYDKAFFPDTRPAFLAAWIDQLGGTALAIREGGALAGYGVIRPCREGFKIGPLYADSPDLAATLFDGLQRAVPEGAPIYLDLPDNNAAAVALARSAQMTPVFETARMYTGTQPDLPLSRIYGVTSFEIG
ncbi:GNAT family N-acetyltransferase [Marinobacterium mangrovicola]|uniref:Acetyltransferase (GNAT) family protein n=1 Tax=Marinobacterium mangrovicola TaxID=1476959 RepID=A0A4R1GJ25_9GAMM|nr:GNAT family N-acetyltransferase [Marinobacterium mangrovicola]TCK08254.1 acetyltransferase (GNAT) family protein [Marinobacterium mangrovicola]